MKRTVLIRSEYLVESPPDLGAKLMASFLRKLCAEREKPDTVFFYGTGVRLLTKASPALDAVEALSDVGVELVACGTCVGYFEIKNDIAVGRTGDMRELISLAMKSGSVVTV